MSPLFKHRETEQHDSQQPFRATAWGEPHSWPVERAEGEPLVFKLRLPVEIELVDVPTLARSAAGAPAVVTQGAAELEQVAGPAGVVLIGALRPSDVPEAQRPVLATLTVAFAEHIKGAPRAEDFPIADSPTTVQSTQDVVKISDKAILINRASMESPGEGMEPVPMIMQQYAIETRFGALVMAFSTANQEMMSPRPRKLYRRIVQTGWIGEPAAPSAEAPTD